VKDNDVTSLSGMIAVILTRPLRRYHFAALALAATVTVGQAQTVEQSGTSDRLQEIVVTAEKRASTVQSTPISMTAISGEELQSQGLTNLLEVAQEVPGVSFRTAGPGQSEFEMRGLASSAGAAPTVGYLLDEIPISPPALGDIGKVVIDPNLFDLDRVEVLRGPQGTLYGAGSMGGTIKLITKQPRLDRFEAAILGNLSDTVGGGFNRGGNVMLNAPLINDRVALRFVATDAYTDGWIDRLVVQPFPAATNTGCAPTAFLGCARGDVAAAPVVTTHKRTNWEHLQGGRVTLLARPTEPLSITVTGLYQTIDMGGYSEFDSPPGTLAHYQPFDTAEPFYDIARILSATVTYDWSAAQLTSATSYWTREIRQFQDASEVYQNLFFLPAPLPNEGAHETDDLHQFSQEVRLASKGDGSWQWLVGGFYSHLVARWFQYSADPFFAPFSEGGAAANPLGILYTANIPYQLNQSSAFGEVSYRLTDTLKLTAGLRYYKFDTSVHATQAGIASQASNATPTVVDVSQSESGTNPRINLAYIPHDRLNVYATAAKGFRPGGVNLPLPVSGPLSCAPSFQTLGLSQVAATYKSDSVWSYEIGEKARFLDGRLIVNGDVYYIRWKGVQQLIPLSCGFFFTANAGDARSFGPELEVISKITSGLTFSFNGAWTDSKITSPYAFTGIVAGTPIVNIPKYTGSAALTYTRPIAHDLKLAARLSGTYSGPLTDVVLNYVNVPGYGIANIRFGALASSWTAYLYADNITNKQAALTANNTSFSTNMPSLVRYSTNQPRTVGVEVSYHF
jgi:iron complex outermembrane receptor protein